MAIARLMAEQEVSLDNDVVMLLEVKDLMAIGPINDRIRRIAPVH